MAAIQFVLAEEGPEGVAAAGVAGLPLGLEAGGATGGGERFAAAEFGAEEGGGIGGGGPGEDGPEGGDGGRGEAARGNVEAGEALTKAGSAEARDGLVGVEVAGGGRKVEWRRRYDLESHGMRLRRCLLSLST